MGARAAVWLLQAAAWHLHVLLLSLGGTAIIAATAPSAKLPFAVHDEVRDALSGALTAFELQVYSTRPIGLTFNATFHVTGFDDGSSGGGGGAAAASGRPQARGTAARRRGQSSGFSLARHSGKVEVGDRLVRVNDHSLKGESFAGFRDALRRATESPPVSYHFRRRPPPPPPRLHTARRPAPLAATIGSREGEGTDGARRQLAGPRDAIAESADVETPAAANLLLIHVWRATTPSVMASRALLSSAAAGSSSDSSGSSSSGSGGSAASAAQLEWEDLGQAAQFLPATFSGRVLAGHRYRVIEVTPADGCSTQLLPGLDPSAPGAGGRGRARGRGRRDSRGSRSGAAAMGGGSMHTDSLNGSIVVVSRGGCAFDVKTHNAFDAGAAGVIVVNSKGGGGGGDEPVEMDSPHMSHFAQGKQAADQPKSNKGERRGRRRGKGRQQRGGGSGGGGGHSDGSSGDSDDDDDNGRVLFPVVSVGKRDGDALRRALSLKQRKGAASVYVEFSLPADHALRVDETERRAAATREAASSAATQLVPAQAGEFLFLHRRCGSSDAGGENGDCNGAGTGDGVSARAVPAGPPDVPLAPPPQLWQLQQSQPQRLPSSAVHFLAAAFGAPVLAHRRGSPTPLLLHRNSTTNPTPSPSTDRGGGDAGRAASSSSDRSAGVRTAITLDGRPTLASFLCEPLLLAARACPPELQAAVAGRFVLLGPPSPASTASATDADGSNGISDGDGDRCSVYDRMAMAQVCGAAGAIVETHEPTLRPLPPPTPGSDAGATTAAVAVSAAGKVDGGAFAFNVPVLSVTARGAAVLRRVLAPCDGVGGGGGVGVGGAGDCGAFVLREEHEHAHAWAHLAPLQHAGAWPSAPEAKHQLLTRLHRRFGHSEEHVAAVAAAAGVHGHGDVLDAVVRRRENDAAIAQRMREQRPVRPEL